MVATKWVQMIFCWKSSVLNWNRRIKQNCTYWKWKKVMQQIYFIESILLFVYFCAIFFTVFVSDACDCDLEIWEAERKHIELHSCRKDDLPIPLVWNEKLSFLLTTCTLFEMLKTWILTIVIRILLLSCTNKRLVTTFTSYFLVILRKHTWWPSVMSYPMWFGVTNQSKVWHTETQTFTFLDKDFLFNSSLY